MYFVSVLTFSFNISLWEKDIQGLQSINVVGLVSCSQIELSYEIPVLLIRYKLCHTNTTITLSCLRRVFHSLINSTKYPLHFHADVLYLSDKTKLLKHPISFIYLQSKTRICCKRMPNKWNRLCLNHYINRIFTKNVFRRTN